MLSYWKWSISRVAIMGNFNFTLFGEKKGGKLQLAEKSYQKIQGFIEQCHCDCSDYSVKYHFSKSVMCVEV